MMKTVLVRSALCILLSIILFVTWFNVAANYDYGALAGKYVFHGNGETCILYLRPDRTFLQELSRSGEIQRSQGDWERYGQSHVSFSSEFLKVSGEQVNASGQAHGEFEKRLGVFPVLVLTPLPNGPTFHRRLLK
jgi:hypothetical protein